jgi:hypothetical protein
MVCGITRLPFNRRPDCQIPCRSGDVVRLVRNLTLLGVVPRLHHDVISMDLVLDPNLTRLTHGVCV